MNGISCYKETSTNENNQKTAKKNKKTKNTRQTYVCTSDPSAMTLVLDDSF